ncbi:hypothetical protein QF042_001970 [Pedobacter sp. W3I1]|nr:hypothetical protein [Pedobacter sp. W3I1]
MLINNISIISLGLYKQEIKELTELLRNDWTDVRDIATDNGLNIDTYLPGFIESTNDKRIISVL